MSDINFLLAMEIERNPCLYNTSLIDYSNKIIVAKAWKKIATKLKISVSVCKEKWRNMRSSFIRSHKNRKPYYLAKRLRFVTPYMKPLKISDEEISAQDINTEEDSQTEDQCQHSSASKEDKAELQSPKTEKKPSPKKRTSKGKSSNTYPRKIREDATVTSRQIGIRHFLLSLLPEFENMSDDQIRCFKFKSLVLLDDIKARKLPEVYESDVLDTEEVPHASPESTMTSQTLKVRYVGSSAFDADECYE